MTAQLHLDVLEWITAGEAVLGNVGGFGRGYDRSKVERFQKANNALAGLAINGAGSPAVQRIAVDRLWGPETANALKVLLKTPLAAATPSANAETFRVQQWQNATTQARLILALTQRRRDLDAAMAAAATPSPVPNAAQAAGQEAQAAVAAAHEPLTAPPAPEAPAAQPPPDVAPPGPQPPAPNGASTPVTIEEQRVFGRRQGTRGNDVPWFAIGLGVLAFTGVIGWAVYRKGKRSRS